MRELLIGFRALGRAPAVSAAAILSIALGIGATTSLYAVVRHVILRPLPFADADRLVMLWETSPDNASRWVAPANYLDWRRDLTDVVDGIAAFDGFSAAVTGHGTPERLRAVSASGTFFTTLAVAAAEGRVLGPHDDAPGAPCVAVLAAGLRTRRFGSAPVVGEPLVLDGRPCEIVGVLPASFVFPLQTRAEVWINGDRGVPRSFPFPGDVTTIRDSHIIYVVARLKPGVDAGTADARLATEAARLAAAYPDTNGGLGARVEPLHATVVGDSVTRVLWLLQAAVGVLLLVAAVNVAHLLMGRAASRRQELAVRISLGARRGDLARQLLGEAFAFALPGGLLGVVLATWGIDTLVAAAPAGLPRVHEIAFDLEVLAAALALTVGTALLVGLAPLLWMRDIPAAGLAAGGVRVAGSTGTRRWHRGLVIGELALAQVLVVGAWLLASSLLAATRVDLGYETAGRVGAELSLAPDRYLRRPDPDGFRTDAAPRRQFVEAVTTRLLATPGIRDVGVAFTLPLSGAPNRGLRIVGAPEPARGQEPDADFQIVTPGYFPALGIRLVAGRAFTPADDERAAPVALVNEAFVRRYAGGASLLGRELLFGGDRRHEIVGVVADTRYRRVEQPADPAFYVPLAQNDEAWPFLAVLVHTDGDTTAAMQALAAAVQAADPAQPLSMVRALDEIANDALASRRFNTTLVLLFGLVAMVMAAVGAYGVMAALATARRLEFSIRAALGAPAASLAAQVLGEAAALAGLAAVLGVGAAIAGARGWDQLLYGVQARDPRILAAAAATVTIAALAAAWPAARRAGRSSPADTLRLDAR
jgi:predicted permease